MTESGCEDCPENTYSGDNASECTPCPDGKIAANGSRTVEDCVHGKKLNKRLKQSHSITIQ